MKRFYTILFTVLALCTSSLFSSAYAQTTITVDNLDELKTALNNKDNYDAIIVKEQIVLIDGTELNGKKTDANGNEYNTIIQVPTPFIDESGLPNSNPSTFGVFRIATGANVTLKYLTIMGGGIYPMDDKSEPKKNEEYYIAAVQNGRIYLNEAKTDTTQENGGTLNMDHCIVQRSERGLYNFHAQTIMTHCKLIRNTARFGAGALNEDGLLIMDGCSFSENRALRNAGALESKVNAKTYLNNTIMANNVGRLSSINNCKSSACYFMNSTITGNLSYQSAYTINNDDKLAEGTNEVYACNSIISNNKFFNVSTGATGSENEIGEKDGTSSTINVYYCLYGTSIPSNVTGVNCKVEKNDVSNIFQDKVSDGIFYVKHIDEKGGSNYGNKTKYFFSSTAQTDDFDHGGLVHNSNGTISTPVKEGEEAASGGCKTYFYYELGDTYESTTVYMGYDYTDDNGTVLKDLGTNSTIETTDANYAKYHDHQVTTYSDGVNERQEGVIGASPVSNDYFYSLSLTGDKVHGTCLVDGASFFSDSYKSGTKVKIKVTDISSNYTWNGWTITKNGVESSESERDFTLTMDANTTIQPNYTQKKGTDASTYYIDYKLNGGSWKTGEEPITSYQYTNNSTEEVTLLTPEWDKDHAFLGWIGSNATYPQSPVTFKKSSVGDKKYIAQWSTNTLDVAMNPNYVDDGYLYGSFYDANNRYHIPNEVEVYYAILNEAKTVLTLHLLPTGDGSHVLPKGCPVIFKASKSLDIFDEQDGPSYTMTLTSGNSVEPIAGPETNSLIGNQDAVNPSTYRQNGETLYVLSNRTSDKKITGIGFYKLAESVTTMPAHKAFVKVSATANANAQVSAPIRRLPFDFSATEQTEEQTGTSVATDIDQISNEQLQMSNKLLIDGHLYIIRDARMYNAQGQLVK